MEMQFLAECKKILQQEIEKVFEFCIGKSISINGGLSMLIFLVEQFNWREKTMQKIFVKVRMKKGFTTGGEADK